MLQLGIGQPPVQRTEDAAQLGAGIGRLQVFNAVLGENSHPLPGPHTQPGQHMGQPVDPPVELGIAQGAALVLHRDGGGNAPRLHAQHLADGQHAGLGDQGGFTASGW